ncbi:hypothetical protein PGN35_029535 [Nodosilinea sp. PGN35]|uniref:hypothetical protein n=1 Tax=Nodosilinea sp. PGN35 TaxID=3020489 RepID=UPI0023B26A17|nr:hypothetical protein [Nodosilinea sp. TSF1-S3]MDF0368333.1 hypothetical protein [Nodosilinea sp. TSF1-S3]
MPIAVFFGAGLVAFALSFWLTRRLQRPRRLRAHRLKNSVQGRSPFRSAIAPSALGLPTGPRAPDLDRQVRELVGQGRLIDAVKRVRETNGCSLGDAKAYVEERLP